ncbi:MAG: M1 family metallopeptidase [Fimbriimonadaceae bacterium]|nr:M1 family metallopeptidase [Fimbriimonadaceae bacterium]
MLFHSLALATLPAASPQVSAARLVRTYDLLHVKWQIELDARRPGQIVGQVTNRVRLGAGQRVIEFHCGPLTIRDVRINNRVVRANRRGEVLSIPYSGPTASPLDVTIRYSGKPQSGVYYVAGERAYPAKTPVYYTQGEMVDTRYWLPTYDAPNDKATSEGTLILPKGWKALSNGALVARTSKNGREIWSWRMAQPHATYLISFVAGPYSEIFEQKQPLPVSYWVPPGLETMGKAAFDGTADMIREFGRLTGLPYPYAKYSQSAVPDFMFGGMENITCTTQTIDTLHDPADEPFEDSTGLVAHELAHQWFGNTVTTPDWPHIWINEGWATFMPPFIVRQRRGEDAFDLQRRDLLVGAFGAQSQTRPMIWNGYEHPIDIFDGMAYGGGAARMYMLMHELGEATFWRATKAYLNEYKYRNPDTEDFFRSFSKTSGRDLTRFKQQWFYTAAAPTLRLRRDGKRWTVEQADPAFRLKLELTTSLDGQLGRQVVTVDGPRTELPVPADLVLPDPNVWLCAQIDLPGDLTPAEWKALWKLCTKPVARMHWFERVFERLNPTERDAVIADEPTPEVQAAMLRQVSDEALAVRLTKAPDKRVQMAAVRRLAEFSTGNLSVERLRELSTTHPSPPIRFAAYEGLYRRTQDITLVDRAWQRPSARERYRLFALDAYVSRNPDLARTLCLTEVRLPHNEALRQRAVQHLGRLRDAAGTRAVYQALVTIAQEPSHGTRSAAISALAEYGDPAAIAVLEPMRATPQIFLRRTINDALTRLRTKK